MVCPKCGSNNVNAQMVSETQLKVKRRGCLWWCFIGWWWFFVKWLVFTIPALIVKIFSPKKYKTKTIHKSMWVCQNCGYHWQAAKNPKPVHTPAQNPAPANTQHLVGELVPIRYYGKGDEQKRLIGYVEARAFPDFYSITQAQYSEAVQKCQAAGYDRPQFRGDKRLRISMDE